MLELRKQADLLRYTAQFYSWYIYPEKDVKNTTDEDYGTSVSSAEFIEDVNSVSAYTDILSC